MKNLKQYIEINKKAWDKRTPIHIKSNFYNNQKFIIEGNSLQSIEINALGNIEGKEILHLQCHFGQDSISLAKKGAKVTAIDFSKVAIFEAKKLSKIMMVDVEFIESDVLDIDIDRKFDIVFTSYGTIGWLPNLEKWGQTISKHLKKGGKFILTEFHPFFEMIKDNGYNYFHNPIPDIQVCGTYTDGDEKLNMPTCWWSHTLTDIFTGLESNNLKLTSFEEFDYSPFHLEGMIEIGKSKYVLKTRSMVSTPYIFNLTASKK